MCTTSVKKYNRHINIYFFFGTLEVCLFDVEENFMRMNKYITQQSSRFRMKTLLCPYDNKESHGPYYRPHYQRKANLETIDTRATLLTAVHSQTGHTFAIILAPEV